MHNLCATVIRLGNEFKKTAEYEQSGRRILNSYRQGLAIGIVSKLKSMLKEKEISEAAIPTGMALVVVKQIAVTEKYGDFGYTSKKTKVNLQGSAYAAGYATGKNVGINTAIKGKAEIARLN